MLDELATAYVQAIAATAGATIAVSRLDYGVDGTLKHILKHRGQYIESGFPVDFQLKGTRTASVRDGTLAYDLKVRNYNLLVERDRTATPYYLFLVCFDGDVNRWIVEETGRLILHANAYWWAQLGAPSTNQATVRIAIPLSQQLSVQAMQGILSSATDKMMR
ncbi:MAG: DUF4365 domain-containing protein [Rhodoplanes sp.]